MVNRCDIFSYGVSAFITSAILLISHSDCRDLRPSDHGLAYQGGSPLPSQNGDDKGIRSFFGGTTSSLPLPEARNVSSAWWPEEEDRRSRDTRRDHVKIALLVASAACGLAGVVLLVVSGIVFLLRLKKRKTKSEGISSRSDPICVANAANDK